MTEDQTDGTDRNLLGRGEQAAGKLIGSDRLESDGIVDRLSGAVQKGFGSSKDALERAIDDTPALVNAATEQGRKVVRRTDDALRYHLGENGPGLVAIGVVTLFALGAFALTRRASTPKPKAASSKGKTVARKAPASRRSPKPKETVEAKGS